MPRAAIPGLLSLLVACATPAPSESTEPSPTSGHYVGNAYENKELGLRVTLPTGWVFFSEEQLRSATYTAITLDTGALGVTSRDRKSAVQRAETLFAMQDVVSAPGAGSPAALVFAFSEDLSSIGRGVTKQTYAAALLRFFDSMTPPTHLFEDTYEESIAGRRFLVLPAEYELSDIRGRQDYYVDVAGDRALVIIATYPIGWSDRVAEALAAIGSAP